VTNKSHKQDLDTISRLKKKRVQSCLWRNRIRKVCRIPRILWHHRQLWTRFLACEGIFHVVFHSRAKLSECHAELSAESSTFKYPFLSGKIQSNLGYTNLSCTKSWIIRIFCPVPAKSPPIESLSCTKVWVIRMFSAVPCDSYNPGLTVWSLVYRPNHIAYVPNFSLFTT